MANIFIIHGTNGHPQENWFPWLKAELEKLHCNVFVPKFPTPEGQTLENWLKVFEEHKCHLGGNPILVGHSLGVAFLLSVLETTKAKAAFFVAGFTGPLGIPNDGINKSIAGREFDWKKIRKNCKRFYVFNSDNDPYVPLETGKELARNLGTEVILVKGAGHFNAKAGYTKFPLLLEKIKNEM